MRLPLTSVIENEAIRTNFEVLEEDTGWIEPALLNEWKNLGGVSTKVAYRRVQDLVELKGTLKPKESGKDVFVLPKEFRPVEQYNLQGIGEGPVAVYARILPAGNIALFYAGAPAFLSIDNIRFRLT